MKRLAFIAALVAALMLPAAALADGPPPGAYSTKITAPAVVKGTWVIKFTKAGTYTIVQNGKVVVHGKILSIDPQVQFYGETGPRACKSLGFYNWKRSGKVLKFSSLSDPHCAGRAIVLSHKFTLTS